MKVVDPGHAYKLNWLDGHPEVAASGSRPHSSMSEDVLIFVKREGAGYPGNVGHHAGTNIQEVLRALIDRVQYLDRQIQHPNNIDVLSNLRHALWLLEERAAERHGRTLLVNYNQIETEPTCRLCGHVGCLATCH